MRTYGKSLDNLKFLAEQSNGTPLTRIQRTGAPLQSGVFFSPLDGITVHGRVTSVTLTHSILIYRSMYTPALRDTENKASR